MGSRGSFKRLIAVCVMTACIPAASDGGVPARVSNIIVFGDSYQDDGAGLRITTAAVAAHIPGAQVRPAAASDKIYWSGRWSNGPTMVEVLARLLGVPLTNYAVGGAKSGSGNYDAWLDYFVDTGVQGQIESFALSNAARHPDPDTLYIISASTNDYGQFHDFHQPGRISLGDAPSFTYEVLAHRSAENIRLAVERLIRLGARNILVFSAYPLAEMPESTLIDPQVADARKFGDEFDRELKGQLRRIAARSVRISIFPIGERIRSIIQSPADFGFRDTSHACQITDPRPEPACSSPAAFLWWDEIHPSAALHELLGRMLRESLTGAAAAD